jgi:hypothetical protein
LIVLRERDLRTMIAKAIRSHEAALARSIHDSLDPLLLAQWRATITQPHDSYAGAYVFGRYRGTKSLSSDGQIQSRNQKQLQAHRSTSGW